MFPMNRRLSEPGDANRVLCAAVGGAIDQNFPDE